jgi:hypothetical protein
MTIHLADYQTRLLLGTPVAERPYGLLWKCGCAGRRLPLRKYEIRACDAHAVLLREVREDDEPIYDSFIVPMQQNRIGRLA